MCGIFGIISTSFIASDEIELLADHAEQRGKDSSGLFFAEKDGYQIYRATKAVSALLKDVDTASSSFVMGHSRLITNGLSDNQPVYRDAVCVIHNGIVVNHDAIWSQIDKNRLQEIDTEVIAAIAADVLEKGGSANQIAERVLSLCDGVVACALALPKAWASYVCFQITGVCILARRVTLSILHLRVIRSPSWHVRPLNKFAVQGVLIDIPISAAEPSIHEQAQRTINLIPSLGTHQAEEKMLEYKRYTVRRCTRCILPETMPYIRFDEAGVCNYCHHYKPRNRPRPVEEIFNLVEPYRRAHGDDCIVPFSGGRDSCYGLHLIAKELKMKPITYTYDWGMVTDLGRRNISRMCARMGVENIIVADDIALKKTKHCHEPDSVVKVTAPGHGQRAYCR